MSALAFRFPHLSPRRVGSFDNLLINKELSDFIIVNKIVECVDICFFERTKG